jgi:hypothetical protein
MPRASSAPRHPARPTPAQLVARGFAPEDWRLLSRLPADIMIATIATQEREPRGTVAEGLAGLDTIAAGRWSDSDLVRAVVAAIFSEPEEEPGREPEAPNDPDGKRSRVLAGCRRAGGILRAGADPADAAAYRHWVQQVAVRVYGATRADASLAPAERRFLDDIAAAIS